MKTERQQSPAQQPLMQTAANACIEPKVTDAALRMNGCFRLKRICLDFAGSVHVLCTGKQFV